jgi:hypothetical protein
MHRKRLRGRGRISMGRLVIRGAPRRTSELCMRVMNRPASAAAQFIQEPLTKHTLSQQNLPPLFGSSAVAIPTTTIPFRRIGTIRS